MNDQPSIVYGQRLNKSRCLTSILADTQKHRFLVGTQTLHADNEIHLLEYSEEKEDVGCEAYFAHKYEVWNLSTCPAREDLFFSVFNTGQEFKTSLWKLPSSVVSISSSASQDSDDDDNSQIVDNDDDDDDDDNRPNNGASDHSNTLAAKGKKMNDSIPTPKSSSQELEELFTFKPDESPLITVLWEPLGTATDRVITVNALALKEHRFDHSKKKSNPSVSDYGINGRKITAARWDPHHSEIVQLGSLTSIYQVDLRTNKASELIASAHGERVRDLDFNPYQQYQIATGGDDGKVKFWDVRKPSDALLVVCGHSHWVCNVRYNPYHDQLVVSSSTDSLINLWRIPSIASKPVSVEDEDDEDDLDDESFQKQQKSLKSKVSQAPDALVKTIDENEESVYSVAWSNKNGWVFGSVSYDGRVLIHQVPQEEKFRILNIQ